MKSRIGLAAQRAGNNTVNRALFQGAVNFSPREIGCRCPGLVQNLGIQTGGPEFLAFQIGRFINGEFAQHNGIVGRHGSHVENVVLGVSIPDELFKPQLIVHDLVLLPARQGKRRNSAGVDRHGQLADPVGTIGEVNLERT